MDRGQEEMQFLELFGIFKESYKIISSWRKLFTKITLALILPLSFIYLVHVEVSSLFSSKLQLDPLYFLLFNFAYFTMFYIFSLLSTAAVVYTIACIYTAREITFKTINLGHLILTTIISVVPKVWKRLIVTFFSIFVAIFLYLVVAAPVLIIWAVVLVGQMDVMGGAVLAVLVVLFTARLFYLATIRQLATNSLVFILQPAMGLNHMAFKRLVVEGTDMANKVVYAIIFIQTVVYFVCKSYHHENIDKSALSCLIDFQCNILL
ncbi:hypothetical protein V6Z12_A05G257400 [Gossypium hirsutum]